MRSKRGSVRTPPFFVLSCARLFLADFIAVAKASAFLFASGIVDYPTFGGVTATADELRSMNSYFINDMITKMCSDEDTKEVK